MSLPKELEEQLTTEIIETREEESMPFISPMEEIIQEKAMQQARREDIVEVLQVRFGEVPPSVVEAVNGIKQIETLKQLFRQAIAIASVAEFQQLLNSVTEG